MDAKDVLSVRPDALAPDEVEAKAEQVGLAKAGMLPHRTFVLAVMAGLFIGMGGMYMLLIRSDASLPPVVLQLLGGLGFCLGLFLVIAAGAELFTGNCLMVCGALSKRYTWAKVLKNWGIVYVGNLAGSILLVALLFFAHFWALNDGAVGNTMMTVAASKITQDWVVLLFKGIMCNLLVCLAVWIGFASRTIVDRFVAIILPISAFVACGFEHCVANMFFLPMAFILKLSGFVATGSVSVDAIDIGGILYNLSAVTLGNIIGGALLVGVSYWVAYQGHLSGRRKPDGH